MPYKDPVKQKKYYKEYNILNKERRKKQRLAKRDEYIEYNKQWRKDNKEHVIAYRKNKYNKKENTEYCRKRRAKFSEYYKKYQKEYNSRKNVIDKKREKNLLCKYNINLKDYEKLLKKQKNKCDICKVDQKHLTYKLHVDHDHDTGKVRSLLCTKCNVAVGYYENSDIKIIEEYIAKHKKRKVN